MKLLFLFASDGDDDFAHSIVATVVNSVVCVIFFLLQLISIVLFCDRCSIDWFLGGFSLDFVFAYWYTVLVSFLVFNLVCFFVFEHHTEFYFCCLDKHYGLYCLKCEFVLACTVRAWLIFLFTCCPFWRYCQSNYTWIKKNLSKNSTLNFYLGIFRVHPNDLTLTCNDRCTDANQANYDSNASAVTITASSRFSAKHSIYHFFLFQNGLIR